MVSLIFKLAQFRQFFVFISVGLLSTVIDVGIMQSLIFIGLPILLATSLGYIGGLVINFMLHLRITFAKSHSRAILFRFSLVILINYLITVAMVRLSLVWFDYALIGKLASLPVVAINGFCLSKFWVFKDETNTSGL